MTIASSVTKCNVALQGAERTAPSNQIQLRSPMSQSFSIRTASEADAAALLEIYRPCVETTAISFEEVAPGVEEFAARIRNSLSRWSWLVAEANGRAIGYAYGHAHREKAAYRWSVEVTIT